MYGKGSLANPIFTIGSEPVFLPMKYYRLGLDLGLANTSGKSAAQVPPSADDGSAHTRTTVSYSRTETTVRGPDGEILTTVSTKSSISVGEGVAGLEAMLDRLRRR